MASDVKISIEARNAAMVAMMRDTYSGADILWLQGGTPPGSADQFMTPIGDTIALAAFGPWSGPVDGVMRATPEQYMLGGFDATDTASWWCVTGDTHYGILYGTAGEAADAPDLELDESYILSRSAIEFGEFTITFAE